MKHCRSYTVRALEAWWLPVQTRMPLKFGAATVTSVVVARVRIRLQDASGRSFEGWGETPLSSQWVWPSSMPYELRTARLQQFLQLISQAWVGLEGDGHALELGHAFQEQMLPSLLQQFHALHPQDEEKLPHLAALLCLSTIDLALHDAYGHMLGLPVYQTYSSSFFQHDLSRYLTPASGSPVAFAGRYPAEFLRAQPEKQLPAWHLVGGVDPVSESELTGNEPSDGYPVLLGDWIRCDGLTCLKIKLRGHDAAWDYHRLVEVGKLGRQYGVKWLTADFNCTVMDPLYVTEMLDRFRVEHPELDRALLYVEQPFPYDLEKHWIDVHSVSARKPLFLDESAHDWKVIRLGRELGWTGVALKTCKTQTGAILSACWAKAHGMQLMVQDLTNPMLAQIPHVLLAASVDTIMGVETNAMQFYPEASAAEARVHPGLYQRRHGAVSLESIVGSGFGLRVEEIARPLPDPSFRY